MYKGIDLTFVNLKTLEGREGLIIQADIKYNGKKIATYRDDGNGGCVDINAIGSLKKDAQGNYQKTQQLIDNRALLEQLNAEFKTLPKVKAYSSEFEDCIEFAMDDFISNKEILKNAKKGLVVQTQPNSPEYSIIQWKAGSVTSMLKKYGKAQVVPLLEKAITKEQKKGNAILAQDYYISIGVNPEIFTK
ncbi:MAG: hypothetical protein P8J32_01485 [bacterium]|nr:hypothetical protein [bacterium]